MAKKKRKSAPRKSASKATARKTKTKAKPARRARAPRKKALLIGVNEYQAPGNDLRGCVNDVLNIESAIEQYCGFSPGNVKKLIDSKATTRNIRNGIEALTDGAQAGDVLFLHYSGHGSSVPDKNGDEADHRDEILCPTDLDWSDPLLDDWLHDVFKTLPAGVNLSVIFDCCHSGSATREIRRPDAKILPRYLPCPLDLMATESGRSLSGKPRGHAARRKKARARRKGSKDVTALNTPEVLISGCRDDQTSADAYIQGTYNGALTYNLVRALARSRGRITYRKLHADTVKLVKAGYTQAPQLSGKDTNLDRPFLAPYA